MTVNEGIEETKKELKTVVTQVKEKKHRVSVKIKNAASKGSNMLTRSKPFKALVNTTFIACDTSKTGDISKSELYVGLLSIHIKLARYAGPAATFPPSREVSDEMFEAADMNGSEGIDKNEFESIIIILCAHIMSRMLVYYAVLLVFVPWFARRVIDKSGVIPIDTYWDLAASQTINLAIFYIVVPLIWDAIDAKSTKTISDRTINKQLVSATTTTTTTEDDNDDDDDDDDKKNK